MGLNDSLHTKKEIWLKFEFHLLPPLLLELFSINLQWLEICVHLVHHYHKLLHPAYLLFSQWFLLILLLQLQKSMFLLKRSHLF